MCEILVASANYAVQNAEDFIEGVMNTMYADNNDGIGLISVYTDGEEFSYEAFKGAGGKQKQNKGKFISWLKNQDGAWRIVVHARLATAGGIGFEQTHPINIIDDDVDSDWVVHNGVISSSKNKRINMKRADHEFNTKVDSEVIAHTYDDIPDDIENLEEERLYGTLNWLLFSSDSILIQNNKYTLTEDFRMTCRSNWEQDDADDAIEDEFALLRPDKSVQTKPKEYKATKTSRYARWTKGAKSKTVSKTGSNSSSTSGSNSSITSWSNSSGDRSNRATASLRIPKHGGYEHTSKTQNEFHVEFLPDYEDDDTNDDVVGIKVVDESGDEPTPVHLARTILYSPKSSKDYRDRGSVYTDTDGIAVTQEPEPNVTVKARLVEISDHSKSERTDIKADPPDESDETEQNDRTVKKERAQKVTFWHHYNMQTPEYAGGYCSHHDAEFGGIACSACLDENEIDELIEAEAWENGIQ